MTRGKHCTQNPAQNPPKREKNRAPARPEVRLSPMQRWCDPVTPLARWTRYNSGTSLQARDPVDKMHECMTHARTHTHMHTNVICMPASMCGSIVRTSGICAHAGSMGVYDTMHGL